ncbi:acyl- n-acyltransferase [Trichoderma arundinaceum]|uniref:Acyl-n-acyltransferase n=1 Tax=Trichoderma arundinaceum TaxID=490622 RepID=A0A395P1K1_TRIAR|nr:acyl- n-acyltransferase [Trichoderma arundinaceum]
MASSPASKPNWRIVKTAVPVRPLPLNSSRPPVTTDRLIIRALVPEDVHELHILRTQPEVMANNPQGRIDRDLEETRPKLNPFLPPNDEATYNFAICLKETGEMIGIGGCHMFKSMFGWPAIGYMFRKEFWGQGLATEFVKGWLDMWCKLPREAAELEVDSRTLQDGDEETPEQVIAFTLLDNLGSQRVLEKSGFERFVAWEEADLRNPAVQVTLLGYRYFPNKKLAN